MAQDENPRPRAAIVLATLIGFHHAAARVSRLHDVLACVNSLCANTYDPLEIIVVDQSPHEELTDAVRSLMETDSRLRYIHTDVRGKTRALNTGIRSTFADIYAFTDDDCVVPPDWVGTIVDLFRRLPNAGILFGSLLPPREYDETSVYVPSMVIPREERLGQAFLPRDGFIWGADMAIRREVFTRVGLFDESVGPGADSGAYGEEIDIQMRALRAHPPFDVYLTPELAVTHEHGARPQGGDTRTLMHTYQIGSTAVMVKYALRGDLGAACRLIVQPYSAIVRGLKNLVMTGRPTGIGHLAAYLTGIERGVRLARMSREPRLTERQAIAQSLSDDMSSSNRPA